jgi:hypothetical protein
MAQNLKFKKIIFSKPFSVVNCDITGLTIDTCIFTAGAYAQICPNQVNNYFNDFTYDKATFENLPFYQTRYGHNVTIKNCEFIEARKNANSTDEYLATDTMTAIYMKTVDGANINGNIIHKAGWNGI